MPLADNEGQPATPKKSKLDVGYDEWACDAEEVAAVGSIPINASVSDEIERYMREAKPTTTENLLNWWKTEVGAFWNDCPYVASVRAKLGS